MRFCKWISVPTVALLLGGTVAFGYQKIGLPGVKPQNKERQPVAVEFLTPEELKSKIAKSEPIAIVDLRGPSLYARSDQKIKGAVHAKVRRVVYRLRELPRDREIITYCSCPADEAAVIGAQALLASGFTRVRVLKGGWNAWVQSGGQVQSKPKSL